MRQVDLVANAHHRVVVLGTSASGKTTLARALACHLDVPHVELDRLHHGPGWTRRTDFVERVASAADAEEWIADGNYAEVRSILWPRATAFVWLNYSLTFTLSRAVRRSFVRGWRRDEVFPGCRESLRASFLDLGGIPWWVLRTHRVHRATYPALLEERRNAGALVLEMHTQRQTDDMIAEVHAVFTRSNGVPLRARARSID